MSIYRNKKTNLVLTILSNLVSNPENAIHDIPITLNVSGQLISGILVGEKEFYNLESNAVFKAINDTLLKEKNEYFTPDDMLRDDLTEEEIDKIPDVYFQKFIYLKNARYISGSTFLPSENSAGIAIHVRLSDVSSFNYGTFSTNSH